VKNKQTPAHCYNTVRTDSLPRGSVWSKTMVWRYQEFDGRMAVSTDVLLMIHNAVKSVMVLWAQVNPICSYLKEQYTEIGRILILVR